MITSGSKNDLYIEDNKTECYDLQYKEIGISGSVLNDESIEKTKNDCADDLKSEDSLDLEDNFPLKSNLTKQHVKEIRRLSRDIVKGVIETARNSIHELYEGKSENSTPILSPDKLKIPNHADNNLTTYVNEEKQMNDDKSEFDAKVSKEKCEGYSDNEKNQTVDQKKIVEEDTICGFGCFHPKWVQKYSTPRVFLVLFSIIGIIHGCYYSYVVAILSTLEKRYAFKTKVSGVILLADEITPLILGILVGYVGGKTHRPRMVAIGMFLSALCCFVSGLPYLFYGMSMHNSNLDDKFKRGLKFCASGINSTFCSSDEQPPTLTVIGIFLLASFLKGFATLSFYVIGFSYMDGIIKRKKSPLYFGKSYSFLKKYFKSTFNSL